MVPVSPTCAGLSKAGFEPDNESVTVCMLVLDILMLLLNFV